MLLLLNLVFLYCLHYNFADANYVRLCIMCYYVHETDYSLMWRLAGLDKKKLDRLYVITTCAITPKFMIIKD